MTTAPTLIEVRPHQYVAEASDLRLPPGQWPGAIVIPDFGNRRPLLLHRVQRTVDQQICSVVYRQEFGCIQLTVYND